MGLKFSSMRPAPHEPCNGLVNRLTGRYISLFTKIE